MSKIYNRDCVNSDLIPIRKKRWPFGVKIPIKSSLLVRFLFLSLFLVSASVHSQVTYCTASGLDAELDRISNVTFGSININSVSNSGYEDFSSISTSLAKEVPHAFSATASPSDPGDQLIVWIDFNQNGSFDDAGEKVFTSAVSGGPYLSDIMIPSTALLGTTKMRVRLHYASFGGNTSSCGTSAYGEVEDYTVIITAPPSCSPPTALVANDITVSSAILSWTASTSSPANGYSYYFSTSNAAPDENTTPSGSVGAGVTTANVSLDNSTTYYFWVKSNCAGESSAWASGGSFITLCVAANVPYIQNFESVTTPAIPICTSAENLGSGNLWETSSTIYYGFNSKVLRYFYNSNNPANTWFYTQGINLIAGEEYKISYKYGSAGSFLTESMKVAYGTSPVSTAMTNSIADYPNIAVTQFVQADEYFTAPSTGVFYFGFNAYSATDQNVLYVDDISIILAPTCFPPTALGSSAVTTDAATLSWTVPTPDPSNGYDVYYSPTNTAPTAATTASVLGHIGTSINITGLDSANTYFWWVRSDCGGGDKSEWASGGSFTTICSSTTVPYLENFESASVPALPNCTTNQNVGTGNNWVTASNPGFGFTTKALKYGSVSAAADAWFYTQGITLTAGKTYGVSYDYGNRSIYAEKMKVAVGTSNVNTAMTTQLADYPNIVGAQLQSATVTFTPTVDGVYYFGFNAYSIGDQWQLYLDNIKVEAVCPSGIWTGTLSADFNTANNWADNMVPEACTNVSVNVSNPMTISSDVSVASLALGATAVVTLNGTLNVGNISVAEGGMMTVANDAAVLQTALATNSGMVTVKRNSHDLFRQDYTLWASPVGGQNLRAFSTQTLFNRFSSYDSSIGANGNYVQEIVTTADMNSKMFGTAKGYLIRMPNNWTSWSVENTASPYLGSFTGTLNNGAVSIALSGANNKLNLVGNPYASPISIASFLAANTNIDETLYFWRKQGSENSVASGYATYTSLGMVSADLSIDATSPINIEVGQGFFVVANSVTPGNLVFNNTMRNDGAATFYKGVTTTELHRFWLNLSNDVNVVGQTLIGYKTGATQGVDAGVDAMYFNDSPTALTSLINDAEYIIQGRSVPFVNSDIVPLGFKSEVAGNYTISLANFDGLFAENQDIFLKDNVTGIVHDLKLANYTFATPVGVHNTRFEVQYTNSTLGTDNPISADYAILIGVKDQKIKINAGSVVMEKIELIDVAGRVIYTQEGVNATTATLENVVSTNQMLIVRISTASNGIVTQKIIF